VTTRAQAWLLLILTLAPLVIWTVLFIRIAGGALPDNESPELSVPLLLGIFLAPIILLGLIVFYIVHLYRRSGLDTHQRVICLVALIFLNVWAMPFYWYFYIWRKARYA
jgi:heme/copper-type cytochrome/quinol oxidase subunit 2